ncbi:hypothetical protein A8C56_07005 [Niabella ginsenosidivorans]|uniref:Glycosyltransferase subfamily 4-like N-terminal domain-containing protein n=1 Tax=Niabella ginsenosidivorans TaxID=1176587 RepID=A0A1A9I231_9BACT|nr:glycosyltransferase family 4 protein [Niabella ginsenosidivorans]ANH80761.1 hypothetical protein A8C56_07005 [Niabella ginsenosidivorans]
MIKIASLVSYSVVPPVTGGEKGIYYFLKYLSDHCDLTCFTVQENQPLGKLFTTIPVLGSTQNKFRYVNVFLFFKIRKLLRQQRIDYLIIEHPYYGWLGYLLQKFAGTKIIVHSHNIEALRFKDLGKWWWNLLFRYERKIHQLADLSFFISPEDRNYAIQTYFISPEKCTVITYGTVLSHFPFAEKELAREKLCRELELPADTRILLFNGTLNYQPNLDAVDIIIKDIAPLFKNRFTKPYRIVICGKGLPAQYNGLKEQEADHILFKGYVDDIHLYFAAADLFLNPIADGGGIKTKLVEALGTNTPAVSFKKGAYGVPAEITDNNLRVVADKDINSFVAEMIALLKAGKTAMPAAFYDYFSWDKIAQKAIQFIQDSAI